MLGKIISYFSYKYLFLYSWLIAIAIYLSRSIWGYGSFITIIAQFWADFVAVLCFVDFIVNFKEIEQFQKKVTLGIIGILSITLFYYFISPETVDMKNELLGEKAYSYDQLKLLMFSLLAYIPASQFTRNKILNSKIITFYFFVLWGLSIIVYFANYNLVYEHYGSNIVINNAGYLVLALLPLCFVVNIPIRILYLLSCMIFCFMSAKRGAAIESAIFAIIIYYMSLKHFTKYKKILLWLLGCGIAYGAYYYFVDDISAIFLRFDRDGVGSESRNQVVYDIISGYLSGDFIDIVFGFGALSTVRFAGNYAHNDFLEVLCNYGLLGFFFLIYIYVCAIKKYCIIKVTNSYTSNILLIALLTCVFKSFVSMNFYSPEGALAMLAVGYSMCCTEKQNELNG